MAMLSMTATWFSVMVLPTSLLHRRYEKDGKYYPMGAYGQWLPFQLFNIYGKKENPRASLGTMDAATVNAEQRKMRRLRRATKISPPNGRIIRC